MTESGTLREALRIMSPIIWKRGTGYMSAKIVQRHYQQALNSATTLDEGHPLSLETVAKTLEWINEVRARYNLEPLDDIAKGNPGDECGCPIANSLAKGLDGHTVFVEYRLPKSMFSDLNENWTAYAIIVPDGWPKADGEHNRLSDAAFRFAEDFDEEFGYQAYRLDP